MEYRRIRLDDEVVELCLQKQIDPPTIGDIIFGAYDDGKLVGICALKQILQVEPLVAESSSLSAHVLAEKALAVAAMNAHQVVAMVRSDNTNFISQLERYGFVITDKSMTILKKEV